MLKSQIDKILEECIKDHLAPAEIVDVISEEAEDHDGDPILNITVVFQAEDDELDPEKVVGLALQLRKTLLDMQVERFPIPSYMTIKEAEFAAA